MSNDAQLDRDEHVFVPSAKWLVGLVGALVAALVSLLVYVWSSSQDERKDTAARIEKRLEKHESDIQKLQVDQAVCCPLRK